VAPYEQQGQLLAQFKNTALLSCPLYMHMYMFLCFIHGQINDDDDDDIPLLVTLA